MLKKITSYSLCIILTCTTVLPTYAKNTSITIDMNEQEIRNHYPDAKIIHVDEDEYPLLAENLRNEGYTQETGNNISNNELKPVIKNNSTNKKNNQSSDCNKLPNDNPPDSNGTFNTVVDISDSIIKSGNNSGSGDGAVIVFVIIGTILVVVWALYVFKYLYDLSSGFKPCEAWYEFAFTASSISRTKDEHIDFNGLRFMTGFRDNNTDIGIAVELGNADILLTEIESLKLNGYYWMLGPMLRWRLSTGYNPHYFQMNFMGGTTEHDEIGVIAKATLGFRFGIGKYAHIGFSWGAMNINLNEDQGIIRERDQYHYLYGVNTGFRF